MMSSSGFYCLRKCFLVSNWLFLKIFNIMTYLDCLSIQRLLQAGWKLYDLLNDSDFLVFMQELLYLYGFVVENNPDDYLMVMPSIYKVQGLWAYY